MISKENKRIPVTMPREIYNELAEIAKYEDRSVSNLIYVIIKDYLKNKREILYKIDEK